MPPITGSIQLTGPNGTFEFEINRPGGGAPDTVTIKFTPKDTVRCGNIRLAQTSKATAYDRFGRKITGDREEFYDPPRHPFPHRKGNETFDGEGDPVSIDSLACEGDPWYNGDDAAQDTPSQGSSPPPRSTTMVDVPQNPFVGVKPGIFEIVVEFETCAICVDTGECLGCIRWSSTSRRGNPGQDAIGQPVSVQPCSGTFDRALKKFIERHSKVDPADGKLKWFCPEADGAIAGPGGLVNRPFGGEIPDGLKKKLLQEKLVPARVPIRAELIGTGASAKSPASALSLALREPRAAALKFTWASGQDKSKPSVVFTPLHRLAAEDVSPFIPAEAKRFGNDFSDLRVRVVTPGFLKRLAESLAPAFKKPSKDGPVLVTLMAELRSEKAEGAVVAALPGQVYEAVRASASHPDVDPELLRDLHYVALNMGQTTESTRKGTKM
jgi:hypothetical protein